MKFSIAQCFVMLSLFSPLSTYAADEISDTATGVTFPKEVSFDAQGKDYQLDATGVSTRKKLIIKVYSVAHYLQKGAHKAGGDKIQEILSDQNAKQLTIKWVRGVTSEQIQEGYRDSFKAAIAEPAFGQLQNEMNVFVGLFKNKADKGDEHVIRWIPGGTIEVYLNGEKAGSIKNEAFAKGLWGIWFGSKSVVNRDNLISLMK